MFRKKNSWLRQRMIAELRINHKDLYQPFWKSSLKNVIDYVSESKGWWLVLLTVILIFSFGVIVNIESLNLLNISYETANTLVDQRAGNIATITSITLVVVGFLINNIAVKEALTYKLLFKHSYLYPIIYFTLSTIGCFFIFSTLRDTLEHDVYVRIILTGTYLSIAILFFIGFLFIKIIEFTNDKVIWSLLHEELINEANKNIKELLLKKQSQVFLKKTLNSTGATEYTWGEAILSNRNTKPPKEDNEDKYEKEKLVYDIKLSKLSNFIISKNNKDGIIYYRELAIGNTTTETDNYIWKQNYSNSNKDKKTLRRSLMLKKINLKKVDNASLRKYFDQKIIELCDKRDFRNLDNLLESYLDLYELQMRHQK
jgi:hypothetical protein